MAIGRYFVPVFVGDIIGYLGKKVYPSRGGEIHDFFMNGRRKSVSSDYISIDDILAKLEEFEEDLHRHIHLENNILFPRALKGK